MEFLLTALRRALLAEPERLRDRSVYEFACVLIQQCANNGYVFHTTAAEREQVDALKIDPAALFEGQGDSAGDLMLAGLYKPLSTIIDPTLARRGYDRIAPRALRLVIANAITIEQKESEIAMSLPQLTAVTDEISQRVADQYRSAPYPRWLSLQAPEPGTARQVLGNYFGDAEITCLEMPFDVLIAGAGTCQQAVHSAITYGKQARVLGADLKEVDLPAIAHAGDGG